MTATPIIRKAKKITGRTLVFRDVTRDDAAFILTLRTDSQKAKHLSPTSPELSRQISWLEAYADERDQAYFIIECGCIPIGVVRLYDAQGDSFGWGSWILANGAPKTAAIESALMVYVYAIDYLQFRAAHFEVRKGNRSVWEFHERFGAVRTSEAGDAYFYEISLLAIQKSIDRYIKFLPNGITANISSDMEDME